MGAPLEQFGFTLHHYVLSRIIQLDHNQILSTKENLFNKLKTSFFPLSLGNLNGLQSLVQNTA
jgi:hypothetical protein